MRLQKNLKYLSFVMIGVIALMISYDVRKTKSIVSSLDNARESSDETSSADSADTESQIYVSRLSPGIINDAMDVSEIPRIDTIPWMSPDIRAAYKKAEHAGCKMLPSGVLVHSSPTSQESENIRGGMRIAPLTIRLEIDDEAKSKLPASTRNQIITYLRDHQIAVEPTVYRNEEGQAYFGGSCRAAFYDVRTPALTVASEPMVQECMERIRVLGVLKAQSPAEARTLLLAVRYATEDPQIVTQVAGAKFETELLFFHLAKELNAAIPSVSVFVTSEGRRNLHHLDVTSIDGTGETALMTTKIRFDNFVMMGLYPASPVVTGVQPYKSLKMDVSTLLRNVSTRDHQEHEGFQEVLDRIAEKTDISTGPFLTDSFE